MILISIALQTIYADSRSEYITGVYKPCTSLLDPVH